MELVDNRPYDNPLAASLQEIKKDRQMMRRRALQLFRRFSKNTMDISRIMDVPEHEAARLLWEGRSEEYRLKRIA